MNRALALCAIALVAACSESIPESPYAPSGDVSHLMHYVLDPAASKIWSSAGTIITEAGAEDLAPTTEEGWSEVLHAAAVVSESGNLLMMPGIARDEEHWMEIAKGLIKTGKTVFAAAEAKDADAVFDTGGHLYNVCVACHSRYMIEPPS
jgi:hypothetical protein